MSILSDRQIKVLSNPELTEKPMIVPFHPELVRQVEIVEDGSVGLRRIVSKGLSSYGYDISLSRDVKIFSNVGGRILDVKNFDEKVMVQAEIFNDGNGEYVVIPPNGFVLGVSNEWFNIPVDVTAIVLGKSTYARVGQVCICTPMEAGWSGRLVLEFANCTPLPNKLYIDEGCAQSLFFRADAPCDTSYADREGKYQNQEGVTPAKV